MASVRAKFRCNSVELFGAEPTEVRRWTASREEPIPELTWPRIYRFTPMYDPGVPAGERYSHATPTGELRLQVDNPAVAFRVGHQYYLEFTPVEEAL